MLSDEEKKAIKTIKKYEKIDIFDFELYYFELKQASKTILNLIEKQSKEIEELKEDSCCITNCVRRDKEKLFLEDKIKAKIEEVKDGTFDAKIVLQSLLEKE